MTTTPAALRRPTAFVPFRTPVRGHLFAARPPAGTAPVPGQRVALCREPENPTDPYAVAVWIDLDGNPWRIGYLAREVAARVAPRLDAGIELEARVDGWVPEPQHRWQRPVLAVFPVPDAYEPTVTQPATARETATPTPTATPKAAPATTPRAPSAASVPAAPPVAPPAPPAPRPARSLRRRITSGQSR